MHIRGFHNREVSVISSSGHGCHAWRIVETKQKRKQDDKPDTGKHNTQDTHGTTIYSNWTLIYRVGAAGHHNDNNQKQNKHGKATTQTTQQHDNESNE